MGCAPPAQTRDMQCMSATRKATASQCLLLPQGTQASLSPRKGVQQSKCEHEGMRTTVVPGEQLHLEGGASLKGKVPKVVTGTWRTLPWALLVSDLPQG